MTNSKFVEAGGLRVHYLEAGAGTPLILLHGGLATAEASWRVPLPDLAKAYHVLAPDSRGHGRTGNPALNLSYAQMADDLAAFIDALGLERPLIAGYSDGGQIALEFGLGHPGKARALVLGGTVDRLHPTSREGLMSWGIRGPGDVDHAALENAWGDFYRSLPKLHGPGQAPDHWRALLDQISALWIGVPTYTAAQLATVGEPALVILRRSRRTWRDGGGTGTPRRPSQGRTRRRPRCRPRRQREASVLGHGLRFPPAPRRLRKIT
jgi:pimeloyl-ACP methyl ester carboxylesterase